MYKLFLAIRAPLILPIVIFVWCRTLMTSGKTNEPLTKRLNIENLFRIEPYGYKSTDF